MVKSVNTLLLPLVFFLLLAGAPAQASTRAALGFRVDRTYGNSPHPLELFVHKRMADNRRWIAAGLAFPLPVGFLGAHRIFLGTKPYIPVAYVGTLGGCGGAVPLVDFFVILFTPHFEKYLDNPRFFMWLK